MGVITMKNKVSSIDQFNKNIMRSMMEYYRQLLSERTKEGIRQAKMRANGEQKSITS